VAPIFALTDASFRSLIGIPIVLVMAALYFWIEERKVKRFVEGFVVHRSSLRCMFVQNFRPGV
jgi:hypothetical protein